MPEVGLGVIPGMGGTQRLVQRIGVARARELIYTGALIDADAALRIGLVNEVTEPAELLPRACAVAAEIATRRRWPSPPPSARCAAAPICRSRAPLAVAAAKRALRRGPDLSLADGLALERQLFAGLFATHDQKGGDARVSRQARPRLDRTMNFDLSPEQKMIRDTAPRSGDARDRAPGRGDRSHPTSSRASSSRDSASSGLLGIMVPEKWGRRGDGCASPTRSRWRRSRAACASTAVAMSVQSSLVAARPS